MSMAHAKEQVKLYIPTKVLEAILQCFKFTDVQRLFTTSRMVHHLLDARLSKIPDETLEMAMNTAAVKGRYLGAHAENKVIMAVIGLLPTGDGCLEWVDETRLKFVINDYGRIIERLRDMEEQHTEETIREMLKKTKDADGFDAMLCGPDNTFILRFTHLDAPAPSPSPPRGQLPDIP